MVQGKKVHQEKKKFTFQHKDKAYKVIGPSGKIAELAENEENRVFSELFRRQGVCTRQEMEDELERRGLWTKKEREYLSKIREEIDKSVGELSTTTSTKEKKVYQKIKKLREEERELSAKYDNYFERTVEARAENARLIALVSLCTLNEDGTPVWKNVSDFKTETDMDLVTKATSKFLSVSMGIEIDSLELLEDRVLRKKKEREAEEKKKKGVTAEKKALTDSGEKETSEK